MAKSPKISAALGFGLAIAAIMAVPAQVGAQQSEIVFLPDANVPAQRWAEANPDGIAITIRLGSGTEVPPEVIQATLRRDFQQHGVRKVRFFWERGGNGGSSAVFGTRNHVWGPFGLADSRDRVAETASQFLFEVERGIN